VQAVDRVAAAFARAARRSLPFLVRYRAQIVARPAGIVSGGSASEPSLGGGYEVSLSSRDGHAWGRLALDAGAMALTLDGALGGRGDFGPPTPASAPTPAQRALLARVMRSLAADLAGVVHTEVNLSIAQVPGDVPASAAGKAPDLIRAACSIEGVGVDAALVLSLGADAVEEAVRDVDPSPELGESSRGDPRMALALQDVEVEAVVELGRLPIGLRRILALQVGDVLRLPTATDDPLVVRVGDVEKLYGTPVVSRGQLALEIVGRKG
jgi:flagellar motor switch protein FliM